MKSHYYLLFCFILSLIQPSLVQASEPIKLTGSNGKIILFTGVLKADPHGLTTAMKPDNKQIHIAWKHFDMEALKAKQPDIFKAYQEATQNQITTSLKLGIFEGAMTYEEIVSRLNTFLDKDIYITIPTSFTSLSNKRSSYQKINFNQKNYKAWIKSIYLGNASFNPWWDKQKKYGSVRVKSNYRTIFNHFVTAQGSAYTMNIEFFKYDNNFIDKFIEELETLKSFFPNPTLDPKNSDHTSLPSRLEYTVKGLSRVHESDIGNLSLKNNLKQLLRVQ